MFRAGTADKAAALLEAWMRDAVYCRIKPLVAIEKKVQS